MGAYHKSYVNIGPNFDPQYQIAYVYNENSIILSMLSETNTISQIGYIESEGVVVSDDSFLYRGLYCLIKTIRTTTERDRFRRTGADTTPPYLWQDQGVASGAISSGLTFSYCANPQNATVNRIGLLYCLFLPLSEPIPSGLGFQNPCPVVASGG